MKLHKILFGICWTVLAVTALYMTPFIRILPFYLLERFGG